MLFLLSCLYFVKDFIGFLICFEKSKRELGRALLACLFTGVAEDFSIPEVYLEPIRLSVTRKWVYHRVY
jgi:hypothetical protein